MNDIDRLELRRSETAARLSELAAVDEPSPEQAEEMRKLTAQVGEIETRWQAASAAERLFQQTAPRPAEPPKTEPEADKELLELRSKVSLVRYANAALRQETPDGAEAEYSAACGLPQNQFPLHLLETRATTTGDISTATGGVDPSDHGPASWMPVAPRVFETPVTSMLGITMETVPVGEAVFPILTAGSSPGQFAEDVDDSTVDDGTLTITTLTPKRMTSTIEITGELEMLVPGIESALRNDVSMAMASEMESQILTGDGTAPNVAGIKQGLTATTNPTAVTSWTDYASLAVSSVDGSWANSPQDVQILLPIQALTYGATLWAATPAEYMNALEALRKNSRGVLASAHLPNAKGAGGVDAKVADGIAIRAGGRPYACRAVWSGVRFIRDEVTKASRGITRLTAVAFWDFQAYRREALRLIPIRHTA